MLGGKKIPDLIVIWILSILTVTSFMATSPVYANPTCGSTITTKTTLTSDLTCTTSIGIEIDTNGVILNCAGHSITGNDGIDGIRIDGSPTVPVEHVTVENCVVKNWQNGLIIEYGTHTTLKGNTATGNEYGFDLFDAAASSSCEDNTLTGNSASGNQVGFYVGTCSSNIVKSNKADSNSNYGFYISNASGNTLKSNTADSNTNYGFYVDSSSSGNTLTSNTANSNLKYGYVDASTGHGTAGTANTYNKDKCSGNTLGCSLPSGL